MTKTCIAFLFVLWSCACFSQKSLSEFDKKNREAIALAEKGKLEEAFKMFLEIRRGYEKARDKLGVASTLNNMGRVYLMMDHQSEARKYMWQAYHIYRSLGKKSSQAEMLTNIGASYEYDAVDEKGLETALVHHRRAHQIYREIGDSAGIYRTLLNIGSVYGRQEEIRKALNAYLECFAYVERSGGSYERIAINSNIGTSYYQLDQPEAALPYLYKALSLKPSPEYELYTDRTLAKVYAELNMPDSVSYYLDRFSAAKDKLQNEQTTRNIAELSQKYQAQVRQEEIEKLRLGKKRDRLWYTVIALSLGGIIFILFLFFRNRMVRSEHQKTDLEHRVLRAQMNPHFLFNCLSSIQRMYVEGDTQKANDLTSDFGTLLRQILDHTSRTRIRLKDELATLQSYMEIEQIRLDGKFSFEIGVDEELDVNNILVPSLITQPMVENAIWHGIVPMEGKGRIVVDCRLSSDEKLLVIRISDNGIGFTSEKSPEKRTSKGIELVEKRLTAKGALLIAGGEEGGTNVTIKLPVEYEN